MPAARHLIAVLIKNRNGVIAQMISLVAGQCAVRIRLGPAPVWPIGKPAALHLDAVCAKTIPDSFDLLFAGCSLSVLFYIIGLAVDDLPALAAPALQHAVAAEYTQLSINHLFPDRNTVSGTLVLIIGPAVRCRMPAARHLIAVLIKNRNGVIAQMIGLIAGQCAVRIRLGPAPVCPVRKPAALHLDAVCTESVPNAVDLDLAGCIFSILFDVIGLAVNDLPALAAPALQHAVAAEYAQLSINHLFPGRNTVSGTLVLIIGLAIRCRMPAVRHLIAVFIKNRSGVIAQMIGLVAGQCAVRICLGPAPVWPVRKPAALRLDAVCAKTVPDSVNLHLTRCKAAIFLNIIFFAVRCGIPVLFGEQCTIAVKKVKFVADCLFPGRNTVPRTQILIIGIAIRRCIPAACHLITILIKNRKRLVAQSIHLITGQCTVCIRLGPAPVLSIREPAAFDLNPTRVKPIPLVLDLYLAGRITAVFHNIICTSVNYLPAGLRGGQSVYLRSVCLIGDLTIRTRVALLRRFCRL